MANENPVYINGQLVAGKVGGTRQGGPLQVTISEGALTGDGPTEAVDGSAAPVDIEAHLVTIENDILRFKREYPGSHLFLVAHAEFMLDGFRSSIKSLRKVANAYREIRDSRPSEAPTSADDSADAPELLASASSARTTVTIRTAEEIEADREREQATEALRIANERNTKIAEIEALLAEARKLA